MFKKGIASPGRADGVLTKSKRGSKQDLAPLGSKAERSSSRRVRTKVQKERLIIDRRRQIVDAAIQVFEKKGFHGATLRDVGRAAGVPQGTIYNYVASKEDILDLVCDRIVSDYQHKVRSASMTLEDPVLTLKSVLRGIACAMIDHQPEIRILYREHHHLSPAAEGEIIARIDEFVSEVEHAIAAAVGNKRYNVRFATNIVTFLPCMFALRGWVTPRRMPVDEQVDELVEFMYNGLQLK